MKVFKIILCFFIILFLSACGNSEFMNLYAFTENYNKISDSNLSISDFYFQNPQSPIYTAILGNSENKILLTLENRESDIIDKVTVSIVKEKAPSAKQTELYRKILRDVLAAYCNYDGISSENIISAFGLNENETFIQTGELTLKKDNFYFVYYSTDIISQVMIFNTYLYKIDPTEKPVSKTYYAEDFIIKETP